MKLLVGSARTCAAGPKIKALTSWKNASERSGTMMVEKNAERPR